MIQRIFHPIGQGAFYSERHEDFNIVYDCGSISSAKISDNVVKNAFKKDEIINILFISHFDSDHVNKITLLNEHTCIKRVVLPLLHEEQKNFLTNVYRMLDRHVLTLINNPEKIFGRHVEIIYVKSSEDKNDERERISIDTLQNNQKIQSGTILTTTTLHKNWIFIPHNHKYFERNKDLEVKLGKNGFDVAKLKNDPNYTLEEIKKNTKKDAKKKFNEIYKTLKKDGKDKPINENSMILYSGIDAQHSCYIDYNYSNWIFKNLNESDLKNKVSCIYTGDTDLNIVKIREIYKTHWQYVNTIQIPHHGAEHNFDKSVLSDKFYICPISARKNNKNHPSPVVVKMIIDQSSCPILITEDPKTKFIENITIF